MLAEEPCHVDAFPAPPAEFCLSGSTRQIHVGRTGKKWVGHHTRINVGLKKCVTISGVHATTEVGRDVKLKRFLNGSGLPLTQSRRNVGILSLSTYMCNTNVAMDRIDFFFLISFWVRNRAPQYCSLMNKPMHVFRSMPKGHTGRLGTKWCYAYRILACVMRTEPFASFTNLASMGRPTETHATIKGLSGLLDPKTWRFRYCFLNNKCLCTYYTMPWICSSGWWAFSVVEILVFRWVL